MNHQPRTSFWRGFQYAIEGVIYAIHTQRNFRVHLLATVTVVALGYWLKLSPHAWATIILTIGAVLWAELVNTAAETLVDMVSPDYHPMAKQVKDLAAGAVLIMAITSIIVGLMILGPPLLVRLNIP